MRVSILQFLNDLKLLFFALFPSKRGFASVTSTKIVKSLQRINLNEDEFHSTSLFQLVEFVDRHQAKLIFAAMTICLAGLACANIGSIWLFTPWDLTLHIWSAHYGLACDGKVGQPCSTGDNYHAILATIQVTVLAIIVPITITLHDLAQKGRQFRAEIVKFIIRETRVHLVKNSAFAFLIWIAAIELLKTIDQQLDASKYTNEMEFVWIGTNLLLMAYFMDTAISLINQTKLDAALQRLIVREGYPFEMARLIQRNVYMSLTRLNSRR